VRVIADDGVGLEVRVCPADRASAAPVVLVHGIGGAKEDFADHVNTLRAHGTIVTFDHRGHGDSDMPADPDAYSLDRLAADIVAVADALGFDTFRVLGHSMGGMAARRLVLRRPDRVEALILMNTSPGPPPGMDSEIVELGAKIAIEQGIEELKRVMDAFDPLGSPAYRRTLAERPGYREYTEWKWSRLSAVMYGTLLRAIDRQDDELEALRDVRVPTLVVVGEEDEVFLGVSHDVAATITGAVLEVIPDAGHSPQFENPGAWHRAVDAFLHATQHAGPGTASPA
jgi:3-oxoadipate enol-lactonase